MKPLGKVSHNKEGYLVRFERLLPYPQKLIWEALTDPKHLAVWFTDVEFDELAPGAKMIIRFRDQERTESVGRIVRVDPPRCFEYLWENELATWELYPENTSTRLIFTYSKVDESYALSVPAGWHVILDQLEEVLGGGKGYYPFGGEEQEATHVTAIKASYKASMQEEFPALRSK
ncbi:MAG TPA: SRPBCC domain-containing protein [Chryseolinea sp.]|nr:SRPBCC domain-containing protein [Chryseolinea sp.]